MKKKKMKKKKEEEEEHETTNFKDRSFLYAVKNQLFVMIVSCLLTYLSLNNMIKMWS